MSSCPEGKTVEVLGVRLRVRVLDVHPHRLLGDARALSYLPEAQRLKEQQRYIPLSRCESGVSA